MQEQSKKLVTGKLKEVAYQKIDEQTEALVSMIGDKMCIRDRSKAGKNDTGK